MVQSSLMFCFQPNAWKHFTSDQPTHKTGFLPYLCVYKMSDDEENLNSLKYIWQRWTQDKGLINLFATGSDNW